MHSVRKQPPPSRTNLSATLLSIFSLFCLSLSTPLLPQFLLKIQLSAVIVNYTHRRAGS